MPVSFFKNETDFFLLLWHEIATNMKFVANKHQLIKSDTIYDL